MNETLKSQGALGESHQKFTFTFDSLGCYLGYMLMGGASVSSRPL